MRIFDWIKLLKILICAVVQLQVKVSFFGWAFGKVASVTLHLEIQVVVKALSIKTGTEIRVKPNGDSEAIIPRYEVVVGKGRIGKEGRKCRSFVVKHHIEVVSEVSEGDQGHK